MSASLNPSLNKSYHPPHKRIKKLPPLLVNQLAAGEVVTRPASVVKELIENALDAGAKNIEIRITQGGMGSIEVRDDGEGIHPDDMVMAVTRFATSKVADVAHLQGIATLGFRGEALAATAAVSRLTLTSSADKSGIGRALNVAGILEDTPELMPVVHPQGTSVKVKDLYFNVPARRGNLKSISTEYAHIEMVVKQLALVASDVSFSLWHNDKRRFQLEAINISTSPDESNSHFIMLLEEEGHKEQPNQALTSSQPNLERQTNTTQQMVLMQAIMARLMSVLPAIHDQASVLHPDNLQPIVLNLEGLLDSQCIWQPSLTRDLNRPSQGFMGVTGFLIPSDRAQTTSVYKLLYINGRLVKDRRIAQCLRECANRIEGLQSLGYVLFFNLPNVWLNLNVHPSKQCVKVQNLANVVAHLQVGVTAGLQRWQAQHSQQKKRHPLVTEDGQRQQRAPQYLLEQSQTALKSSLEKDLQQTRSASIRVSEPSNCYEAGFSASRLSKSQQTIIPPVSLNVLEAQCLYIGETIDAVSHILIQLANRLFVFNEQQLLTAVWQLGAFEGQETGLEKATKLYQQADIINKRQLINQWLQQIGTTKNQHQSLEVEVLTVLTQQALCEMPLKTLISKMLTTN